MTILANDSAVDSILENKGISSIEDEVNQILSGSTPSQSPAPTPTEEEVNSILGPAKKQTEEPAGDSPIIDRILKDPTFVPEGSVQTAGREAAMAAVPTISALIGGVKGGTLGAQVAGLPGAIIGGVGGALLTSFGVSKAQDTVLKHIFTPEEMAGVQQQMELNKMAHPLAAWTGEIAPQIVTMKPSVSNLTRAVQFVNDWSKAGKVGIKAIVESEAGRQELENLVNVTVGSGTAAAGRIWQKIQGGDVSWLDVLRDAAAGALLNDPTRIGKALGVSPTKLSERKAWINSENGRPNPTPETTAIPEGPATPPAETVTDNASRPDVTDAVTEAGPSPAEMTPGEVPVQAPPKPQIEMSKEELMAWEQTTGRNLNPDTIEQQHAISIAQGVGAGKPVSASAAEAYGLLDYASEKGYVRQGELLVKPAEPTTTVPPEIPVVDELPTQPEPFFRVEDASTHQVLAENLTEAQAKALAQTHDTAVDIKAQEEKIPITKPPARGKSPETGKLVDNPETSTGRTRTDLQAEMERRNLKTPLKNLIKDLETASGRAQQGEAGRQPVIDEKGSIIGWKNAGSVYPEGLNKDSISAIQRFITGSKMTGKQADQVEAAIRHVSETIYRDMPKETMPGSQLDIGDSIEIDGDPHRVIAKQPDGSITLKDGTTKTIKPGENVSFDQNSWKLNGQDEGIASSVPFSIEKGTLPRQIEAQTPPNIDPKTGKPVALADVRRYLSESLDVPIRKGGFRERAVGLFNTKAESIRQKLLNDLPTALHEIGHYLHFLAFNDEAGRLAGNYDTFGQQFDPELLKLGQATSAPNYSRAMLRQEGVANFTFYWIADPAAARAMAPQFASHWESHIRGQYPEIWKSLITSQDMMHTWKTQPALAKVKSMIVQSADVFKTKTWKERWNKSQSDWNDSYHAIDLALKQMEALGANPDEIDIIRQRRDNYRGGWRGKVETALHHRSINLAGKEVGESLKDILKGVQDLNNLDSYLASTRALELKRRGLESGIDPLAAQTVVNDMAKQYEGIRKRLLNWQRMQRDLLVDSGVISRELAGNMDILNQSYVPFYRIYEGLTGQAIGGTGQGFVNLGQGVFRFKGSDAQIMSPLEGMIRNAYAFRDLAERNQIGRTMMEAIGKLQGGGRIAENITGKMKPVTISSEEIRGLLKQSGLIDDLAKAMGVDSKTMGKQIADMLADNPAMMNVWKQARSTSSKEGVFSVWKDGKESLWQINDRELYRSLSLADESDAKLMAAWPMLRVAAAATRVLRAGATLTPDFMLRNVIRDQMGATIYAQHGFVPIWDGFKGVFSAISKDKWYWEWKKNGGSYSDWMMASKGGLTETLKDVVKDPNMLQQALSWANPLNVIKNLETLSEFMERGTRIAVNRRALEAGISPDAAANLSKETTLNYARHGYKAYLVNKMSAFFNASIRDTEKMISEHAKLLSGNPADRNRALSVMAKAGAMITLPSLYTWYIGKDDPQIQALPQWQKSLFWNINMSDVMGEPFILKIPKPFLLGLAYGTSLEAALDWNYKKDPKLAGDFAKQILAQLPNPLSALMPGITLPIMAGESNYNWFTNRKIVSDANSKVENWAQYTPDTSEVAKYVGKKVDISPLKIDYMVRSYLGGLGRYGTDLADAIDAKLIHMMNSNPPQSPAKKWYDLPGMKSWHSSPYAADKYVDAFYRGAELAEKRNTTFDAMFDKRTKDIDKNWWEKNKNALVYYTMDKDGTSTLSGIREITTTLSEFSKAMLLVQDSRLMNPETKRAKLIQLNQQRNKIARLAYEKLIHPQDR